MPGDGADTASTPLRLTGRDPGDTNSFGGMDRHDRLLFGVIWAIDAVLKWLPGYRHTYLSNLKTTAQGQPSFLHGWFHFWINVQSGAPTLFATLTGLMETSLALVLLLGVAGRAGYTVGAVYALLVWAVGEGFRGPYATGATDIGTGIVYTLMFIALLAFSPRRDVNASAWISFWSTESHGGDVSPSHMPSIVLKGAPWSSPSSSAK